MMVVDGVGVISSVIYNIAERTQIQVETQNVVFTVYAPAGVEAAALAQHLSEIRENVLLVAPAAQVELLQVVGE
jgi:DNA/RNA-binding domain of Phe-tRNA-synthetase-like protein